MTIMTQPLKPVHTPPGPIRTPPSEKRSRTPSPLPQTTDSMESLRSTPLKDNFLTRLYRFFAAVPNFFLRACAYIKSCFVKETVPQIYELPLGDQTHLNFCAYIARGFPKGSHELFRQLRVDWCRRFAVNVGGKQLNSQQKNIDDNTTEGHRYTEGKIKACERFLREKGVQNDQEIRSILSCLQQGFFADFQGLITRAIPKGYKISGVQEAHPNWINLNAESGVASLQACCRYNLVSMQNPSKPITQIQLTIQIPDHRTGIARCHMHVADRNALPPELRTIFEQGSVAAEKSQQTYGPVRFHAPSVPNNPFETIASTYKRDTKGAEELATQITNDLTRNFTFYICGQKIEGKSAQEFLSNYTRMMKLHGISDEDIESIQYCLHQGLIGFFIEELSVPFLQNQDYALGDSRSPRGVHLDIQEGKVTIRSEPFLVPLVDLRQLDPITSEPVTICKMQLTGVIPDHRNPTVHHTDILFKEIDRLPPRLESLANAAGNL